MKTIKRLIGILLTLVLVAGLCPVTAKAATENVSGTVNVSTLPAGADIKLTGATTLVTDVDKEFRSISGNYALAVRGAYPLKVNNPSGHAISVYSLYCLADLEILSAKDAVNANQEITIKNNSIDIGACGDGLYSRNSAINIRCENAKIDAFYADAISAKGDITLQGNYQLRTKNPDGSSGDDAIYSSSGNILLDDCEMNIEAGHYAVYAKDGTFHMEDVILNAKANGDRVIFADGKAEIYRSDLYMTSGANGFVGSNTGIIIGQPWKTVLGDSPISQDLLYWDYETVKPEVVWVTDDEAVLLRPYANTPPYRISIERMRLPGNFQLTGSNETLFVDDVLTFTARQATNKCINLDSREMKYTLQAAAHGLDFRDIREITPGDSYTLTEADRGKVFRVKITGKGNKAKEKSTNQYTPQGKYSLEQQEYSLFTNEVSFDREPIEARLESGTKYVGDSIRAVVSGLPTDYDDYRLLYEWQYYNDNYYEWVYYDDYREQTPWHSMECGAPVVFPSDFYSGKRVRVQVTVKADYQGGDSPRYKKTVFSDECVIYPTDLTGSVSLQSGGYGVEDTLYAVTSGVPNGAVITWQRKGKNYEDPWVSISGVSGSSYTVRPDDLDCYVRAKVTASGYHGAIYSERRKISNKAELTGTVTYPYSSEVAVGVAIAPQMDGVVSTIDVRYLHYNWQYKSGTTWKDDDFGTTRVFKPRAEHVGKNIRVVVTADGYSGELVGGELLVKKQPNTAAPVQPELQAGGSYSYVTVTNAKADQEYVATESNTEPDWTNAKHSDTGQLDLSCAKNRTIYVHTRMRETDTRQAGTTRVYDYIFNGKLYNLDGVSVTATGVSTASNGYYQLNDDRTLELSWKNDAPADSAWQAVWSPICTDMACTTPLTEVPTPVYAGYFVKLTIKNKTTDSHNLSLKSLTRTDCTLELPDWTTQCSQVTKGVDSGGRDQVEILYSLIRNTPSGVRFTTQPEDAAVNKTSSYTFTWALDQTPTTLILQKCIDREWQDGPSLKGKTSYTLNYDPQVESYRIKATKADLETDLISYSRIFHVTWTENFVLTKVSAESSGVQIYQVPFTTDVKYLLMGVNSTLATSVLTWKDGKDPGETYLSNYCSSLYTDEACTQDLVTAPTQGGVYYAYAYIARNSIGAQTADTFDFTQLAKADCSLSLPGYNTQCVSVSAGEFNNGHGYVRVFFKLTKTSADVIEYPLWVGGVQVTSENMDNVLGDEWAPSVVFTPETDSTRAKLVISNVTINATGLSHNSSVTAGIFCDRMDLDIEFNGSNTINGMDGNECYGIMMRSADLRISGYGGLTMTAGDTDTGNSVGIIADNITINLSSTSQINATGGSGDFSAGIFVWDTLTLTEGILEATGGEARSSWGVASIAGEATITGGKFTAVGGARAFDVDLIIADYPDPFVMVNTAASAEDAVEWNGTDPLGGEDSTFKYVKIEPDSVRHPVVIADLPDGTVGEDYWGHVDAQGGSYPYTYEFAGLPDGLEYEAAFHDIIGIPTTPGIYSVTVTVIDDKGYTGSTIYTVTIAPSGGYFLVHFDTHGGSSIADANVSVGETVSEPSPAPTRSGYGFGGWYTNSSYTEKYDFSEPVTGNLTLHARWLPKVVGVKLHTNGPVKDGDHFKLNADLLEAVFHEDAPAVELNTLEIGHLYADPELTEELTTPPYIRTDYYFAVEMSADTALYWDEAILTDSNASALRADLEIVDLLRYPDGTSAMVVFKYLSDPYVLTGFSEVAGGFDYNESLGRYVLTGHDRTFSWKDGEAPDSNALTGWSYGFYDKNSHNVTEEPVPGVTYLLSFGMQVSTAAHGLVDLTQLTRFDCSMEIPGYTTRCYLVNARKLNGYDFINVYFEVVRDYPPADWKWTRLSGSNRYQTMALAAREAYADGSCNYLIIASGQAFPDALSGSALAGVLDCPILLTNKLKLSPDTKSEIERLAAPGCRVLILGGNGAVSAEVEQAINDLGIEGLTTERVKGSNREATAAAVYTVGYEEGGFDTGGTVIIATGYAYADVLSISPYAYAAKAPILLAKKDGSLSDETKTLIEESIKPANVIIVGGKGAVSLDTQAYLEGLNFGTPVNVLRLSGSNRYVTSAEIMKWELGLRTDASVQPEVAMTYEGMGIATGTNFADALGAVSLLGRTSSVMLLVADNNKANREATQANIEELVKPYTRRMTKGYIFGGRGAVSEQIEGWLNDAVQ